MQSVQEWAQSEFGGADLGDVRLERRLVLLASEVAARPAGTVTRACSTPASREGAFRFLENPAVRPDAVLACVQRATLRRLPMAGHIIVPVDGTSLHITDRKRSKGLGAIGSHEKGARGIHVMTALAVHPDGQPIGILTQKTWTRPARSRRTDRDHMKPGGESAHWVSVLRTCQEAFAELPAIRPWYQLDRGADCWQVLSHAVNAGILVTIRAAHDRRLDDELDRLSEALETAPVIAKRTIEVPARGPRDRLKRVGGRQRIKDIIPARAARTARVEVRATSVAVVLTNDRHKRVVELNAVLVREIRRSRDALSWVLLSTHSIACRRDVLEVVRAYTLRWRVEDFHRAWKTGLCRVEDTQLRSRNAIVKWATLLSSVATRAMRLAHQARTTPDAPATTEFSPAELEALIALRAPTSHDHEQLTLALAVRWLAELGGYTGPWNGPPGATVIGRGLHDLLVVSRAFANRARASTPQHRKKR